MLQILVLFNIYEATDVSITRTIFHKQKSRKKTKKIKFQSFSTTKTYVQNTTTLF